MAAAGEGTHPAPLQDRTPMANACTAKPGSQLAPHRGAGGLSTTSPCWGLGAGTSLLSCSWAMLGSQAPAEGACCVSAMPGWSPAPRQPRRHRGFVPTAGLRGRSAAVSCPGAVFAARCFLLRLSPILSPPVACSGPGNPAHFLVFSSQAPMGPWLETPEPRMASPAVSQAALRAVGLGGAARPCQPAARQRCGCWTTASHRPSPAFREPMGVRIATRKKTLGEGRCRSHRQP